MKKLAYYFNLRKYKRNQIVFRQGEIPKVVFVVNTGEFEVSKRIEKLQKEDDPYLSSSKSANSTKRQNFHDIKIAL